MLQRLSHLQPAQQVFFWHPFLVRVDWWKHHSWMFACGMISCAVRFIVESSH